MRRGWAGRGSTREWRKLRAYVLTRDRHVCQVPTGPAGQVCGAPASDAGHIVAKADGGRDVPSNLRAECEPHNRGEGGAIARRLRGVPRSWTWT